MPSSLGQQMFPLDSVDDNVFDTCCDILCSEKLLTVLKKTHQMTYPCRLFVNAKEASCCYCWSHVNQQARSSILIHPFSLLDSRDQRPFTCTLNVLPTIGRSDFTTQSELKSVIVLFYLSCIVRFQWLDYVGC